MFANEGDENKGLNPCFSGPYSRSIHTLIFDFETKCLNPCFSGPYSRRLNNYQAFDGNYNVLILVLVDHTLGVMKTIDEVIKRSLNPCFSGPYSRSSPINRRRTTARCLNPCFSGPYSRRDKEVVVSRQPYVVLILVLVDHTLGGIKFRRQTAVKGLNPCFSGPYSRRPLAKTRASLMVKCLNPCFSGPYSRS